MGAAATMPVGQVKSVALIITHVVKAGEEGRYEEWLADILGAVSGSHGYLGREIFRPAEGARKTYTTIVRFDSLEHLNAWSDSDMRRSFIGRVRDLLEKGDQYEIRTGIDFWFTPEGVQPPKPWKQIVLTVTAVYPLSLIIPGLLSPLFRLAPSLDHELVRGFLMASILTTALTLIMPSYTRLLRRWLYKETV
ncbi:MAG TPA: antibiotic biosynthesis monooxygenase [Pyrinomonadaceae bacterium]|nr:antibiotic biosynthesis monooxygenase [Pyrinomonadaceae bacterium]